jgi:16S rRNA processing protein RimM
MERDALVPDLVVIGEVMRTHGVGGEVRIRPLTDQPRERFARLERCVAWAPATDERRPCEVAACRFDGGTVLMRVRGVDSPEAAAGLLGRLLAIGATEVLPPAAGHFYPWQLAGAHVVTRDGRVVGRFIRVEAGAAQDLWVIGDGGREWLVPAVPEIVLDVDVAARRVVIDPPEGLLDL